MSIVGTRPPLISETNLYELHHRARLAIKPGITGMWQVSGRSDITDFEEVVRLDKEYITNWNMSLTLVLCHKLFFGQTVWMRLLAEIVIAVLVYFFCVFMLKNSASSKIIRMIKNKTGF